MNLVYLAGLSFTAFVEMEVKFVSKTRLEIELVLGDPKWFLVFAASMDNFMTITMEICHSRFNDEHDYACRGGVEDMNMGMILIL